jgi:hypothetical protein
MGGVFHLVSECSSFEGKEFDALGAGASAVQQAKSSVFIEKDFSGIFYAQNIFYISG